MIINELEIRSFGKLENRHFVFADSLNLIYGSNECGKTTVFAFVKFMLYGTKIRKAPNSMSFKEKYMPWNGKPMSGSMTVTIENGSKYVLTRLVSDEKNIIEIIDSYTGADVNDREILRNPGKYFTSLNEEAFSYVSFLSAISGAVKNDKDGEMVSKLSNLSQCAGEEISYQRIINDLNDRILIFSSNKRKNAILPGLHHKLDLTKENILEINKQISEIDLLNKRMVEIADKKIALCSELKKQKNIQNANLEFYKYNELADVIKKIESDSSMRFSNVSEFEKNIVRNGEKAFGRVKIFGMMSVIYIIFGLVTFLSGIISRIKIFALISIFMMLFAIVFAVLNVNEHKKIKASNNILKKYDCDNYTKFNENIAKFNALKLQKERIIDDIGTNMYKDTDKKFSNHFTFFNNSDKIEEIINEINNLNIETAQLNSIITEGKGLALKLREDEEILGELKAKISVAEHELNSLILARDVLKNAFDRMKKVFAPAFSKSTGEFLKQLTSGKYCEIKSDESFNAKINSADGYNKLEYYSRGTCEQVYLAMRLALCDTVVNDVGLPLFLDDAFCTYDDDRFNNVLNLVSEESKSRQIFITSCRSTEFLFFRNAGINIIKL